jgi:hypothetical protein
MIEVSPTCLKELSDEFSVNIKVNQGEIQSFFDKYCSTTVYHIHKEASSYTTSDIYCWKYEKSSLEQIYLGFFVYYGASPSGYCDCCNVTIHISENIESLVNQFYWINDSTKQKLISHLLTTDTETIC